MKSSERNEVQQEAKTWPDLGIGLGLRCPHYAHVLNERTQIDWFEAISENYIGLLDHAGGRPLRVLEKVRENYPVVLHGVSLSIGSIDPLNFDYLDKLRKLADRIQPAWMSDHFCWTGVDGKNLHDLLPLPYTEEVITHLVERISRVQDFLGRQMLFENVSSYVTYAHSEMPEWEFISEIARRADCGILLDVNNIYVSSVNHGFDPMDYLRGIPASRVGQIHLAGHTEQEGILIDTHDQPVPQKVWDLYRESCRKFRRVATMIERDANIPGFEELEEEAIRALQIRKEVNSSEPHRHPTQSPRAPALDAMDDRRAQWS